MTSKGGSNDRGSNDVMTSHGGCHDVKTDGENGDAVNRREGELNDVIPADVTIPLGVLF